MGLFESSQVPVHAILASHLGTLGEVVDFLVAIECLVDDALDVGAGPLDGPLMGSIRHLPEAIVFKSIADQRDVKVVVELEEVTFVSGFIRSDRHWVDVGSKDHELFLYDVVHRLVLLHCLLKG